MRHRTVQIIAALGIFASPALAGSPSAPNQCDNSAIWTEYLKNSHDEQFVRNITLGKDVPGQLYVDQVNGDWTILASGGADTLCAYAYGEAWPQEWR